MLVEAWGNEIGCHGSRRTRLTTELTRTAVRTDKGFLSIYLGKT